MEAKVATLTLVRWSTRVNTRGALGRRLLQRYIAESARLYEIREKAEQFAVSR